MSVCRNDVHWSINCWLAHYCLCTTLLCPGPSNRYICSIKSSAALFLPHTFCQCSFLSIFQSNRPLSRQEKERECANQFSRLFFFTIKRLDRHWPVLTSKWVALFACWLQMPLLIEFTQCTLTKIKSTLDHLHQCFQLTSMAAKNREKVERRCNVMTKLPVSKNAILSCIKFGFNFHWLQSCKSSWQSVSRPWSS